MKISVLRTFLFGIFLCFTIQFYGQNTILQDGSENSLVIKSSVLKQDRRIQVYLPPNYKESEKKYPVLYVMDGQRYFLNGVAFQQNLTWQEIAPEFIIVGVEMDLRKRRSLFYREAEKFIAFLEKELIPEIETNFRTLPERIYFGWEMAAGLGVQIFADNPDLFNEFLLASPTHISRERLKSVGNRLRGDLKQQVKIYSVLGEVENWSVPSMSSLDSIFEDHKTKKVVWEYNLSGSENHYTSPLTTINEGLKLFFSDYGPIRFYSIQEFLDYGGMKELKEHYSKRGKRYEVSEEIHADTKHYLLLQAHKENNFKLFEELMEEMDGSSFIKSYYRQARWFNRFAAFYMDNQQPEKALHLLKLGFEKFPDASILYYGMGNYYKVIGDKRNARKSLKKAIGIAEENKETMLEQYLTTLNGL